MNESAFFSSLALSRILLFSKPGNLTKVSNLLKTKSALKMDTNKKLVRSTKTVQEKKKKKNKMTKVARHSDLFRFFGADILFHLVFHLTIFRFDYLSTFANYHSYSGDMISNISLFIPRVGAETQRERERKRENSTFS